MGRVQWPHRLYIIDFGLVLFQRMKLRRLESITVQWRGRNVEIYKSIRASHCHYLVLQVSGASVLSSNEHPHTYIYNNCDRHPVTKSFLFLSGLVKNQPALCYLWSFNFFILTAILQFQQWRIMACLYSGIIYLQFSSASSSVLIKQRAGEEFDQSNDLCVWISSFYWLCNR